MPQRQVMEYRGKSQVTGFHGYTGKKNVRHWSRPVDVQTGAKIYTKIEQATHKMNPKPEQVYSLDEIVRFGSLSRLKQLVDGVKQLGKKDRDVLDELLVKSCKLGKGELVEFLLSRGADPNKIEVESGKTCLHFAALSGSMESVRSLLEHGADKQLKCLNHQTSAHEAASSVGNHRIAQVILSWKSFWDVIRSRNEKGLQFTEQSTEDAIKTLRNTVEQKERLFGVHHVGLVSTLEKLADAYALQEDYENATRTQERAINLLLRKSNNQEDRYAITESYTKLGFICFSGRNFKQSEATFVLALKSLEKENTPKNGAARERRILERLALCQHSQQKYDAEETSLRRVIQIIQQDMHDTDHPLLVYPYTALGRALEYQKGRLREAQHSLEFALAIVDKHLGPLHFDIATSLDILAQNFLKQRLFPQAEALFRRSLEIREQLVDPCSAEGEALLLTSHNNINMTVIARGKHVKRSTKRK